MNAILTIESIDRRGRVVSTYSNREVLMDVAEKEQIMKVWVHYKTAWIERFGRSVVFGFQDSGETVLITVEFSDEGQADRHQQKLLHTIDYYMRMTILS